MTARAISLLVSIAALALSLYACHRMQQTVHEHRERLKAEMHWTDAQLDSALRSIR